MKRCFGNTTFLPGYKATSDLLKISSRFIVARKLARTALVELQDEMNRSHTEDSQSKESSSAVPPLPPAGWSVKHPNGSNALLIGSKIELGSDLRSKGPQKPRTTYATILAHFQSKDPSLHDPHLDTCEYIPFIARICRPEKPHELWIRYAHVNSTLRTIGMSFVPTTHFAGKPSARNHPDEIPSAHTKDPIVRRTPWAPELALPTMVSLWEGIQHDIYAGPQFRKGTLNTEFEKTLEEFTTTVLGINDALGEFIAQSCYFYEQKEYEKWLARVAYFVDTGFDLSKEVDAL
ncbi:p22 protein precursor [Perkinsela sp. CCAP 1560/4]|nr:p22 protein precursor [Perkinsela sp. CCAP 1560/4]|eukprot:KNH09169.1 p22 protein precursor [Perkinsela sp. CCAP 1560/4]